MTEDIDDAKKMVFFGVTDGGFTAHQRFKIDMAKISESQKNKMSNVFAKFEDEYIEKLREDEKESKIYSS